MPTRVLVCDCNSIHEDVVADVRKKMLPEETLLFMSSFLKAIGDVTRVRILWALCNNEMCVCDLASLLNMTKSAISHQLHTLRAADLVRFRKDGKVVYYFLADDHVRTVLLQTLSHVTE
jgi:ArsR family transcriptional regulator